MRDSGFDPMDPPVSDVRHVRAVAAAGADGVADVGASTAATGTAPSDAQVVQEATAYWRAVDLDLSPVIGRRGTAALFQRALFMTRRTHAWLPEQSGDVPFDAGLQVWAEALAGQAPDAADAARRALTATFHDLLASLIGAALTAQLLRAARAHRPAGEPA